MGMFLNRHRKLRDWADGDVVTKTTPEVGAKPQTRSMKGKSDQPTGEGAKKETVK